MATRTPLPVEAVQHLAQYLLMEAVTANAQVLIGPAIGSGGMGCLQKTCFAPAMGKPHFFRSTGIDGLNGWL